MNSKILNTTIGILEQIHNAGESINGTSEIQQVNTGFILSDLDLNEEELDIRKYYDDVLGENYTARMKIEQDHYLFLEYALKHKISEIQYFHKGENETSRKFIVFSGDCINCIQILIRPDKNMLCVFMRSSDALRLLPMDILACIKILHKVLERHGIQKKTTDNISFFITSAHYYERDQSIVEKLIGLDTLKDEN